MHNFIVAPDSFKGTMDAFDICQTVSSSIKRFIPNAEIKCIPMSDGGEGMVRSYVDLLGGFKKSLVVCDLTGKQVDSEYGVLLDGTFLIEMASCAGLHLKAKEDDPLRATTYGVGQLLCHAEQSGAKKVLIGIGGSGTNDLGIGMASALGYRFFDENESEVEPFACNFKKIQRIEKPKKQLNLQISVACDVDNPLCGPNGATFTFGRQKGIPQEMISQLDSEMERLANIIKRDIGVDIIELSGAGAAGGLGAGLVAFAGAELKSGVELLLDAVQFDKLLEKTDMVFTGEGCIDWQSIYGKVPVGVARRAKAAGVPCVALCGSVGKGAESVYDYGVTAIFSSIKEISDFDKVKRDSKENIRFLSDSVMRLLMINT